MEGRGIQISFQMNFKDYAAARKFKNQVLAAHLWKKYKFGVLLSCLALFVMCIGVAILRKDAIFLILVTAAFATGGVLFKSTTAMVFQNRFINDRLMQGVQTVTLFEKGIQVVSGFQKWFVPWNDCFAMRETGAYLFLLCDASVDPLAINKSKVAGTELQVFLSMIQEHRKGRGMPYGTPD